MYRQRFILATSYEGTFRRDLEATSQAVFHKSWSDATARLNELRRLVHTELYTLAGQRP